MGDDHDVHYDYNDFSDVDAVYVGGKGAFIRFFSMISKVLIVYQGLYGIDTVKKNKPSKIRKLIKISLWLLLVQIILLGIQMLISMIVLEEQSDL